MDQHVLQIMSRLNRISQFSSSFIDQTAQVIDQIDHDRDRPNVLSVSSSWNLPSLPKDLFVRIFVSLFGNSIDRNQSLLSSFLNPLQIDLLRQSLSQKMITSQTDFHYLLGHLPFSRQLSDLLCYVIRFFPDMPSFYQKYLLNQFISPIISSWIFQRPRHLSRFVLHLSDQDRSTELVTFYVIHPVGSSIRPIVIKMGQIITWIQRLYHVDTQTLSHPLVVIYIMTPFRKKLRYFVPNQRLNHFLKTQLQKDPTLIYNYVQFTNPISNLNVNSGATIQGNNNDNYIIIWRQEEVYKVLIHELIHWFD